MAHPAPDLLALVALGEDGQPEVLEHIADCRTCFAEVEALEEAVAIGRSLGPEDQLVPPHPRVWQRIEQAVLDGRVSLLPTATAGSGDPGDHAPSVHAADTPSGSRRDRRRWSVPVLAAAAALVVGLGGGYALKAALDPGPQTAGVTQLNALPHWPGANGTAAIENGPDGQRTLLITVEMPAAERVDGTFEVWMSDSRATDMISMGKMAGTSGRFPIPASVDLAAHPVVDVSLEPPGDTDPAHSETSVVRGRVVR